MKQDSFVDEEQEKQEKISIDSVMEKIVDILEQKEIKYKYSETEIDFKNGYINLPVIEVFNGKDSESFLIRPLYILGISPACQLSFDVKIESSIEDAQGKIHNYYCRPERYEIGMEAVLKCYEKQENTIKENELSETFKEETSYLYVHQEYTTALYNEDMVSKFSKYYTLEISESDYDTLFDKNDHSFNFIYKDYELMDDELIESFIDDNPQILDEFINDNPRIFNAEIVINGRKLEQSKNADDLKRDLARELIIHYETGRFTRADRNKTVFDCVSDFVQKIYKTENSSEKVLLNHFLIKGCGIKKEYKAEYNIGKFEGFGDVKNKACEGKDLKMFNLFNDTDKMIIKGTSLISELFIDKNDCGQRKIYNLDSDKVDIKTENNKTYIDCPKLEFYEKNQKEFLENPWTEDTVYKLVTPYAKFNYDFEDFTSDYTIDLVTSFSENIIIDAKSDKVLNIDDFKLEKQENINKVNDFKEKYNSLDLGQRINYQLKTLAFDMSYLNINEDREYGHKFYPVSEDFPISHFELNQIDAIRSEILKDYPEFKDSRSFINIYYDNGSTPYIKAKFTDKDKNIKEIYIETDSNTELCPVDYFFSANNNGVVKNKEIDKMKLVENLKEKNFEVKNEKPFDEEFAQKYEKEKLAFLDKINELAKEKITIVGGKFSNYENEEVYKIVEEYIDICGGIDDIVFETIKEEENFEKVAKDLCMEAIDNEKLEDADIISIKVLPLDLKKEIESPKEEERRPRRNRRWIGIDDSTIETRNGNIETVIFNKSTILENKRKEEIKIFREELKEEILKAYEKNGEVIKEESLNEFLDKSVEIFEPTLSLTSRIVEEKDLSKMHIECKSYSFKENYSKIEKAIGDQYLDKDENSKLKEKFFDSVGVGKNKNDFEMTKYMVESNLLTKKTKVELETFLEQRKEKLNKKINEFVNTLEYTCSFEKEYFEFMSENNDKEEINYIKALKEINSTLKNIENSQDENFDKIASILDKSTKVINDKNDFFRTEKEYRNEKNALIKGLDNFEKYKEYKKEFMEKNDFKAFGDKKISYNGHEEAMNKILNYKAEVTRDNSTFMRMMPRKLDFGHFKKFEDFIFDKFVDIDKETGNLYTKNNVEFGLEHFKKYEKFIAFKNLELNNYKKILNNEINIKEKEFFRSTFNSTELVMKDDEITKVTKNKREIIVDKKEIEVTKAYIGLVSEMNDSYLKYYFKTESGEEDTDTTLLYTPRFTEGKWYTAIKNYFSENGVNEKTIENVREKMYFCAVLEKNDIKTWVNRDDQIITFEKDEKFGGYKVCFEKMPEKGTGDVLKEATYLTKEIELLKAKVDLKDKWEKVDVFLEKYTSGGELEKYVEIADYSGTEIIEIEKDSIEKTENLETNNENKETFDNENENNYDDEKGNTSDNDFDDTEKN